MSISIYILEQCRKSNQTKIKLNQINNPYYIENINKVKLNKLLLSTETSLINGGVILIKPSMKSYYEAIKIFGTVVKNEYTWPNETLCSSEPKKNK